MKKPKITKAQLIGEIGELRRKLAGMDPDCAITEPEDRYRTLVEQMPAMIYLISLDETGKILYVSPRLMGILGYTEKDLKVQEDLWRLVIHPEDLDRVFRQLARSRRSGQPVGMEYRLIGRDGQIHWFRDDAAIIRDQKGAPLFLQGILVETTDRKFIGDRLQEQYLLLRTLMDAMPMPIYYKDASGRYLGGNRSFEAYFGLNIVDMIGKTVFDIWPKDLADIYYAKDKELFERGGTQVYQAGVEWPNGERRNVVFHKAAFTNVRGELAGVVGVIQDITDRVAAERALKQAHQELEEHVKARTLQLAKANEALKQEIAQRAEAEKALTKSSHDFKIFAHSVVHDLKSPTIGIYGLSRNLKKRYEAALDEKGRKYLEQIMEASQHVANLVDEINTYLASKEAPLKFEELHLLEILGLLKDEFARRCKARGVSLAIPGEGMEIKADGVSILRALRNLIDNALKYGGEKLTEIRIEYEQDAMHHVLKVTDNGVGIRSESKEKIFGLFEREGNSYALPGTGLGLAIVREIARRHQGDIRVMSEPDGRTTFSISISRFL